MIVHLHEDRMVILAVEVGLRAQTCIYIYI